MDTNPVQTPPPSLDGDDGTLSVAAEPVDGAAPPPAPAALRIAPAAPAAVAVPVARAAITQPAPPSVLQTVDIQRLVPVVLDLTAGNYAQWRRLFDTALGMFGLHDHVGTDALHRPDHPDWLMADHAVVHWLSTTISPDLLDAVMHPEDTAAAVWATVDAIFRANQLSRAVYIDAEYHALVQGDLTIMQYCTKLKVFTDQLRDLGQPVSELRQVFHLLRRLNRQYHGAIPHITSCDPLPSFLETRSFLLLEELHAEQAARHQSAHALIAARPPMLAPATPPVDSSGSGGGRGRGRGKKHGRGHGGASSSTGPQPPPGYPAPAPGANSWTGLVQAWPVAWRAPGAGVLGPRPGTPHQQAMMAMPSAPLYGYDAPGGPPPGYGYSAAPGGPPPGYGYSDAPSPQQQQTWDMASLQAALHNATVGPSSSGSTSDWYLDSGAAAHIASNPGILSSLRPSSTHTSIIVGNGAHLPITHTQFERPLLALQTDNGREFDNAAVRSLLATHGMVLQLSCPYTSPQNGKAERILRTLNDAVRSLQFHASMSSRFWAEALSVSTFLLNRRPCRASSPLTPHELLLGVAPDYSVLCVFGCLCYPNTSATARHKLDHRSVACVFLGYSTDHHGYRCFDRASGHVITSCHVRFDERTFSFATVEPLMPPPHPRFGGWISFSAWIFYQHRFLA
ncbi:uncharacterized protein [Aegilops tauschii subsp. strangulata]|uniref:uncharacterized protein n=1 Tax=Aegilops tauschii subsp. strangulata TaxID=200361 RepID=UPI003CC8CC8E